MPKIKEEDRPAELNKLQVKARAPDDEQKKAFKRLEKLFATLQKSDITLPDGRKVSDVVFDQISRCLHHLTPTDASKNPVINQFSRMLFDQVKGQGAYAQLHAPRPDKSRPGKNGPSNILSKFRFYSRQDGYKGLFQPLTKGEVSGADANDKEVLTNKTAGKLDDNEVDQVKTICKFLAKLENQTLEQFTTKFKKEYFIKVGVKGNAGYGILIWLTSLVLGREVGGFSEHVASRIAVHFADVCTDRTKHDPLRFNSPKLFKTFLQAAEEYQYPLDQVAQVLAGEIDDGGLLAMTWVYLHEKGLYTKDFETLKKSYKDFFHLFSAKNIKVSTRWGPPEDQFLRVAIKHARAKGQTEFTSMILATFFFACRSVNAQGKIVLPVAGAEARPYQHIRTRIESKWGYYTLFAKEIGIDVTKPGFFSPTTRTILANLGITHEMSLKETKKILKHHAKYKETLKLDTVDLTPQASTPQAGSSSNNNKKGGSKKRGTSSEEESGEEEEDDEPPKKKKKAKGRTLASDGGKHGRQIRQSI